MKFTPGCCHCGGGCTATINADAKCGGSGSSLTSVTFELRDAADTTTLQTQTGSSASFTVTGATGYKVRVGKASYHTKTSTTVTPGCGATVSVTVSTWPTTYSFKTTVNIVGGRTCPVDSASVAYTGDDSQSGTTNSSGEVTLTFNSTSTSHMQSLSYTITPPSGIGADVKTGSISINACSPADQTFTLLPDSTHVATICNNKYMPEDMTWTDSYGTCTISNVLTGVNSSWTGSYTYTSAHGYRGADNTCNVSVNITVTCLLNLFVTSCSSSRFTPSRNLWYASCGAICRPFDDPFGTSPPVATDTVTSDAGYDDVSCSSSISLSFTETSGSSDFSNLTGCSFAEMDAAITITGTI